MAPENWRKKRLSELVLTEENTLISDGDWIESKDQDPLGEVRLIQLADIGDGRFHDKSRRFLTRNKAKELRCTFLEAGDLLIARMPDPIGRCAIFPGVGQPAVTAVDVCIVRVGHQVDTEWVMYVLNSPPVRTRIMSLATGGTRQRISTSELRRLELNAPPIAEQREIASILRTWDDALEKLAILRAEKEKRLSALRAAMLFDELRLNGQRHDWVPTRLGEVTHELATRNGAKGLERDFVMGVTKAEGIVPMREQTIAGDISRYKRLPARAFAYNPMRINVGSIAMNEREEEVLVSPDYVVFACDTLGLHPDYLDHLRKTSWWAHYINSGGSGSVRQRTYYDDLAALRLPLPKLDEQKAIAEVLNTARDDLNATDREIEAMTLQKRGLMQKLLTGEWRVKVPSDKEAAA